MKKATYIILLLCLFSFFDGFSQLNTSEKRILKKANELFNDEQYKDALPLLLKIDSVTNDYIVKYRIGACYLNTEYQKLRALPFLEEVSREKFIEVPIVVHYDLGILYHYIYRFEDAIKQFENYLGISAKLKPSNQTKVDKTSRMITICKNAIDITSKPFKAEIEIINSSINSIESEFCPMISADEKTMVFMRTTGLEKNKNAKTTILISRQTEEDYWEQARELIIENRNKYKEQTIKLAGLSGDGQKIYLNIGKNLDQDIYIGSIYGNSIIDISKLNKNINTPYYEGRISLSSDGTELYFVSDRPGGFGGSDIYKSKISRRGEWDSPENLGDVINTIYNERSPFLHPDNQTLFFSSEGHKTIGGSDIFKSKYSNDNWETPVNMGFLNSTKDDLYFVLNANGQVGYFSSSKNNIYNKHNIFKVNFKDPIPLTLLKGKISAGEPPLPIAAEIRVYDNETGERIKYVYNPNDESGKYLMIFPPAKNYNILISSSDYLPQLINVHIPYQTYFYELYQEITLQPISIKNKVVGEKVTINNTFYDLYKTETANSILTDDRPKQPAYYEHLLELVEEIIQTTDTLKINYREKPNDNSLKYSKTDELLNLINEAIETSDPITLSILDANAQQKEKKRSSYFFVDGSKEKTLDTIIIGEDTLYTAPIITTTEKDIISNNSHVKEYNRNSELKKLRNSKYTDRSYIHKFTIYYNVSNDKIEGKYISELEEVCRLLLDNESIGAEIYGYADSQGEKRYNLSLSRQRARNVLKYMLDKNINQQKLITKGFGEIENPNQSKDENLNRKVEINIFELKAK